jgi:transposase-like protein
MAKYTDEERAESVALLKAEGYPGRVGSLSAVSDATGIPSRTLFRWFHAKSNPPPANVVRQKTGDLADMMEELLNNTLSRMQTIIPSEDNLRSLSVTAGILTEKMRLLRDQPTENVNTGTMAEWKKRAKEQLGQVAELEDDDGQVEAS